MAEDSDQDQAENEAYVPGVFVYPGRYLEPVVLERLQAVPTGENACVINIEKAYFVAVINPTPFFIERVGNQLQLRDPDQVAERLASESVARHVAAFRKLSTLREGESYMWQSQISDWDGAVMEVEMRGYPVFTHGATTPRYSIVHCREIKRSKSTP